MYCTSCGAKNVEGARFCKACGEPMEGPGLPAAGEPRAEAPTADLGRAGGPAAGEAGRASRLRAASAETLPPEPAAPAQAWEAPPAEAGVAQAPSAAGPRPGRRRLVALLVALIALLLAVAAFLAWNLLAPRGVAIDSRSFPDEALRSQVAMAADLDGDGALSPGELAGLRVLWVEGASDFTGLALFTGLADLTVAAPAAPELELPAMPALETLAVEDAPGLTRVALTDAPSVIAVVITGAPDLELLELPEGNGVEELEVPPQTEVTNIPDDLLVTQYLVTHASFTTVGTGENGQPATWYGELSATYDEQGSITYLSVQWECDGVSPLMLPNYEATYTYAEDGALAEVEVSSNAALWSGTWTMDLEGDSLPRGASFAMAPSSVSTTRATVQPYRRYVYLDDGSLASISYACYEDGSHASEGSCRFGYNDVGQLVSIAGDDGFSYVMSYDAEGRLDAITRNNASMSVGSQVAWYYSYDEHGRLSTISKNITAGNTGTSVGYEYGSDGHLSSVTFGSPRFGEGSGTFETDENGLITHAVIHAAGGRETTYDVEYASFQTLPGRVLESAVDLTDPTEPAIINTLWANPPVRLSDIVRMNRAWLMAHDASGDGDAHDSDDAPVEDATVETGAIDASLIYHFDGFDFVMPEVWKDEVEVVVPDGSQGTRIEIMVPGQDFYPLVRITAVGDTINEYGETYDTETYYRDATKRSSVGVESASSEGYPLYICKIQRPELEGALIGPSGASAWLAPTLAISRDDASNALVVDAERSRLISLLIGSADGMDAETLDIALIEYLADQIVFTE